MTTSDRAKRAFDVALAVPALVIFSPVIAAVAAVVGIALGAPVIFRQIRPGLHGRPFVLLKFRTMADVRTPSGEPFPDEDRLTRVGRVLRRWSLDELPELWNVVKGEMSLVGPRPLLVEYLPRYTAEQARRHDVRPGITGLAQISGRNLASWEQRFELDVWYVDHRSLQLDLEILLRTAVKVLIGEGITQQGHATAAKFTGSHQAPPRAGL